MGKALLQFHAIVFRFSNDKSGEMLVMPPQGLPTHGIRIRTKGTRHLKWNKRKIKRGAACFRFARISCLKMCPRPLPPLTTFALGTQYHWQFQMFLRSVTFSFLLLIWRIQGATYGSEKLPFAAFYCKSEATVCHFIFEWVCTPYWIWIFMRDFVEVCSAFWRLDIVILGVLDIWGLLFLIGFSVSL